MKNVKLNGREIPLTKAGKINKKYLTKSEREILDELIAKDYQHKKELTKKDMEDIFIKLNGN